MAISGKVRVALILSLFVLLILATKTVIAFGRYKKAERPFASVQIGDSRDSVVGRMGKPNYHDGKCGVIHFPDKICAVEYVYSHPFAPLVPEYTADVFCLSWLKDTGDRDSRHNQSRRRVDSIEPPVRITHFTSLPKTD